MFGKVKNCPICNGKMHYYKPYIYGYDKDCRSRYFRCLDCDYGKSFYGSELNTIASWKKYRKNWFQNELNEQKNTIDYNKAIKMACEYCYKNFKINNKNPEWVFNGHFVFHMFSDITITKTVNVLEIYYCKENDLYKKFSDNYFLSPISDLENCILVYGPGVPSYKIEGPIKDELEAILNDTLKFCILEEQRMRQKKALEKRRKEIDQKNERKNKKWRKNNGN